jgi:hypothetical protein
MSPWLAALAAIACLGGGPVAESHPESYLATLVQAPDGRLATQSGPYVPQEGDLVLYDEQSPTWRALYRMVGSDCPDHSGIVVKLPDGRPALLEAGPDDGHLIGLHCGLLEAYSRLHEFKGIIYIRRLRQPLTPEQSARLTDFALAQDGKRYALGRLLLQATPIRCRSGWRARVFGRTYLDRGAWLCAELAVAAGTAAGLFDPDIHHANRIYPRDIVYDDVYDLSATWHAAGIWSPSPFPTDYVAPPTIQPDAVLDGTPQR